MTYYILQSALLLAIAYFLGIALGCWLRKLFAQKIGEMPPAPTEGFGLPEAAGAGAAVGTGIGSTTLAGNEREASIEINRRERGDREARVDDALSSLRPEEPIPAPAPVPEPAPRVDIKPVQQEIVTITEPTLPTPPPTIEIREPVVDKVEIEEVAPPPRIDDLTRIKGVGLPIALELKKHGITRFEQVARWTDEDVAQISHKLGFSGRIERENWMDQARLLAEGEELAFTTRQVDAQSTSGQPSATTHSTTTGSTTTRGATSAAAIAAAVASVAAAGGDDLTRINGISVRFADQLKRLDITRFDQIAGWSDDDVKAVSRQLGLADEIERNNWVKQAASLTD